MRVNGAIAVVIAAGTREALRLGGCRINTHMNDIMRYIHTTGNPGIFLNEFGLYIAPLVL